MVRLLGSLANLELPQSLRIAAGQRPVASPLESGLSAREALQQGRKELTQTLVARYASGSTVKQLAAEFGMHHRTVKARLQEAGVEIRIRERKLTEQQISECVDLYNSGWSTAKVGAKLGVSHNTVRRHLHNQGVTMRPMGRPPKQGR